jgi:hypothetical protein
MCAMAQRLDINGMLISSLGDRIPCKLVGINEKGYLDLFTTDTLELHGRYQFVVASPRIHTPVKVTYCELEGDSYRVEVVPEESVQEIRSKIIQQKVRGIIK